MIQKTYSLKETRIRTFLRAAMTPNREYTAENLSFIWNEANPNRNSQMSTAEMAWFLKTKMRDGIIISKDKGKPSIYKVK